jgi:lipopolysaccharide/colanic/teichoic acid biosynthesis glycosyltransferase
MTIQQQARAMAPLDSTNDAKLAQVIERYANKRFAAKAITRQQQMRLLFWLMRLWFEQRLKRLLDLTVAALAISMVWPLMLLTAVAIRLDSPGPIIFQQKRVGKWGKPFTCYKFRSMCIDAEQRKEALRHQNEVDGPVFKMQTDPRVTRVGRIIRKLSIDELPQLFNVLRGDMSLVGPRPPLPNEVDNYQLSHLRRLDAVPGLTGLQQVSGRSDLNFERWVELDLQYIAEQNLQTDLYILLKTVPTVLFGKGAY